MKHKQIILTLMLVSVLLLSGCEKRPVPMFNVGEVVQTKTNGISVQILWMGYRPTYGTWIYKVRLGRRKVKMFEMELTKDKTGAGNEL